MSDNPNSVWYEFFAENDPATRVVVKCGRIPQRLPDGSLHPEWKGENK